MVSGGCRLIQTGYVGDRRKLWREDANNDRAFYSLREVSRVGQREIAKAIKGLLLKRANRKLSQYRQHGHRLRAIILVRL
jgi:hypothetical protein